MDGEGTDSQDQQDQFAKILTALGTSVAEGLTRGLEESKLLHQLVGMVQVLTERVEEMEQELKSLQDDRKQAVKQAAQPVAAAVPAKVLPPKVLPPKVLPPMSKPTVINRSRNRTISRPTVTYRKDPRAAAESEKETCSEAGCDRPVRSRGLCSLHYQRMRYRERKIEHKSTNSDPLPPPPPPKQNRNQGPQRHRNGGTRAIFALLYEEKGRKMLAGLINQMKFDRSDLVQRINVIHEGMPGIPLDEEDVIRCIHYHKLGDALKKREAEIICRHLSKQRGSLGKTAQKMKMDVDQLKHRIDELALESETTKIRTGFREEILEQASFNKRLDLALTREKYLKDLGIEREVDASLKKELDDQIARLVGSDDLDQAKSSIREALSLDEERLHRLLKRFNLELALETFQPAPSGRP
jgi:hypothetical protein